MGVGEEWGWIEVDGSQGWDKGRKTKRGGSGGVNQGVR